MPNKQTIRTDSGFTLLEVLITIIVIGIAATAIMGVFTSTIGRSANPLIQQQAIAIAEAYMEELQLKQYCHNAPPPALGPSGCVDETPGGGSEGGETRATYNDVQDYDGLNGPPADQNGVAIVGLGAYQVDVSVAQEPLGGVNGLRIDVAVNHPAISPITLSGFRMNY